ncbi:dTDP-4-dehydrorhamnose 3,5-epimerase family protein [Vibrio sp. PP-XX7]
MNIIETNLDGIFEIQNKRFEDERGVFIKTFHEDIFREHGLKPTLKKAFFNIKKVF